MESVPREREADRRRVFDDAVPEEMEFVGIGTIDHPEGRPIIHSTNRGFRRAAPTPVLSPVVDDGPDEIDGVSRPRTATSVNVAPAFRPLSGVQLPAVPLALQSVLVGVGSCPRAASFMIASGNVGPSPPGRSRPSNVPFVASLARGVGNARAASRSEVGPLVWFDPLFGACGFVVGVGSLVAAASANVIPRELTPCASCPLR